MEFPLVLENDPGMRVISGPRRCYYCNQEVGIEHGLECVCVQKRVMYG